MHDAESVLFGAGGLDRAAHLRSDPGRLAALLTAPSARVTPVWRGKSLLAFAETTRLGWIAPGHPLLAAHGGARIFLGFDADGAPRFAQDVSAWDAPDIEPGAAARFSDPSLNRHPDLPGMAFAELRSQMALLDPADAGDAATARGVFAWHETHRFCARCGAPSEPADAGWRRACPACGGQHFPRTDPVVIMLVTHGERVLLGRQRAWPEGMHSLLAGFMEPGETLEAAVRRETWEEAGIRVGRVLYLASQPWPFPSSLMLGMRGEALTDTIRVDEAELESALWVTREHLVEALAGRDPALRPARHGSIARFLLERWAADTLD